MFSFSRSLRRLFATETRLEQRSRLRARTRPRLEALEDRVVPAVVDVTTLSDAASHSGTSLRDAIAAANPGDTIQFQAGLSGAINLSTAQGGQGTLTLSKNVTIDGSGASITIEGGDTAGSSSNTEPFNINAGVTVVLNDLIVSNGYNSSGGGIMNQGTLTFSNSTLANNSSSSYGGGIYNNGYLTILDSTLDGNSGEIYGGGIFNSGTITITNSTLANNSAKGASSGGAITNFGSLTVTNATIVGNSANVGGGIYNGNTLILANTILVNNEPGNDFYNSGTITTAQNNLIQWQNNSPIQNGVNGNIVTSGTINPGLDPTGLQYNGGPTQTIALMAGSPAIDAGTNAFVTSPLFPGPAYTDQRGPGFARIVNGKVDIGAYEARLLVVPSPVTAVEGTSTGTVTVATFANPGGPTSPGAYTSTIDWGDGTTSPGTISGPNSSGVFTVTGSHTYPQESTASPIKVTVNQLGTSQLLTNPSFESGNYNGWTTSSSFTNGQFFSAPEVVGSGISAGFGFFSTAPTNGNYVALEGFDGGGPGTASIAQDLILPVGTPALSFDYRAAWDMFDYGGSTQNRIFKVDIEPYGGGTPLQTTTVLTAQAGTKNLDTGNQHFSMDLSSFAGSAVRIALDIYIPQSYTGPGQLQIDNVGVRDAGATATGYGTATVADARPVLSLPPNQTFEATSAAGAFVNFTGATATDYDDNPVAITYSSAQGSQFPLGTTTVTAMATNADGTTASGTFTITVQDTTPPTTSASLSGSQDANGAYIGHTTVSLSANDLASGVAATYYILDGGPRTTYSSPFNVSAIGSHTLAYWSVDNVGNVESQHTLSFAISPSIPTVLVSDARGTYNGSPYAATATVNGGSSLEGVAPIVTYYQGTYTLADLPNSGGSSTAPTNAGSYTVVAYFPGSTDYTSATALANFTISQRPITVTAAANSKIYDGTTSASDTPTLTSGSLASGDTGTFTETYDNRNVGTTHVLTPTGTIQNSSHVDVTADYSITFATINTGGITAKALTYSGLAAPTSKVYDGTTTAAVSGTAVLQSAETTGSGSSSDGTPYSVDSVSLTGTPTGTYNSKDVATANMVTFGGLSLTGAGAGNYTLTASTEAATITPKTLTVSGLSASNKTYDATAADPLTGTAALTFETAGTGSTSDGEAYTSDSVSLSGTTVGTFAGKDVGTGIAVTVSGNSLGGAQAGDYVLATNEESGLSANITPKTLFVSGLSASNKIYDATTAASLSGTAALLSSDTAGASTADGHPYSGDTVNLTSTAASAFTGTFTSKDVANGIVVDVTGNSLTGAQAGDYVLSSTDEANSAVTANITPKALTYSGLSAPTSKVYDGTTTAAVSGTAVLQTAEAAGSGSTSDDKPYTGDSVSLTGTPTGTYNSKDVATANTVTFGGLSLAGANSGDYTLTNSTQAATITQKTLAVSGISAADKVYDGTTTASLSGTGSLVGVVSGDTVTLDQSGQSGVFASKDVANGITVTVSGLALGGGQAGDYQLGTPQYTTTASITPKTLTASIVGDPSKTYDGTTTATLTSSNYSLSGLVGTESFTITQTAGTYNSAHVASATTVTTNLSAADFTADSGTLASDYALPTSASGAGQITTRTVTASIVGDPSKIYDGNTGATLNSSNFQLSNLVSGESFTVTQKAGTYNSAHVASANTVTASLSAGDFTAGSGTLASDYTLPISASGAGQITARSVTASIIGDPSKTYDGSTTATLTASNFSLSDLVGGESFTVTQTAGTYNSAHVLAANTVTAALDNSDFTAGSGTLASDYNLPTIASGAGQITARTVSASIIGDPSKTYDGSTSATLNSSNFQPSNLVGGESFTVTQTVGNYNSAHVASANTVTASLSADDFTAGSGTMASDYTLPTSASGAGQITARTVSASIIGDPSKIYDGNTGATLNSSNFQLSNLISGESFTVTQTAGTYNSAHVASASTVTATLSAADFTAGSGTLASDYSLPTSASGAGQITARTISASIIGDPSKSYDGSTSATLTTSNFSLSNLVSGESFTVTQTTGTYNSAHVASASTVTASLNAGSFAVGSGTLASDYTLPTSASGAGQITSYAFPYQIGNDSQTYGSAANLANDLSTAVATGVNGETLAIAYSSTGDSATAGVGAYAITGTLSNGTTGLLSDYNVTLKNGTLTVNPALLTVTANNASRIYGVANPTFTYTPTGFVNGETASVLSGSPTFTTPATASSAPGKYTITIAQGTLTAANYIFSLVNGTLTVSQATLSASGVNFSATAGAPFSGAVATFTNADPFGNAGSYTAFINWGDGSTSHGVISGTGNTLTVTGSHTFADPVNKTVSVTISHNLGYTTTASVSDTATVTSLGQAVQAGEGPGIGFWHNTNGQALIDAFNGVSSSTVLANWLASTFPNIYGVNAGSHNVTGMTNIQVAAFYLSLFSESGPKLDAQVMATAFNVYATTLALGGAQGQSYGFLVDAYGLGARSYNVGSNGAAFGVPNDTTLNVYEILLAANAQAVNGVLYNGNATLQNEAVNVFGGINAAGGI